MRAQEGTFRGLMTQDRQFRVPLYQRHYRWRTDQQDDLWRDIFEQYQAIAYSASDVPRHFIGSVVAVERDPDPLHDFRDFRIVDGQQRLTTLSVAIAALRDVAAKDDPDQFDRFNAKYLVNTTEPKGSDRWARLVPGEEDAHAYWTMLTDPENASGHTAVGNAYRFFLKRIGALRDAGELQTERLATTIGDRLSLVFVTVSEGERPHKIFESINATGVGLSQSDLLRNYLFMALGERSTRYARASTPARPQGDPSSGPNAAYSDRTCPHSSAPHARRHCGPECAGIPSRRPASAGQSARTASSPSRPRPAR